MQRLSTTHHLSTKHRLSITLALAALACAAVAATAVGAPKGQLFQFRGDVLTTSPTSLQVGVEGGNRPALRALLGQSQEQTFTLGSSTEILVWEHGVPHVGSIADLKPGDWVNVNIRAAAGSTLAQLEATAPGTVGDVGAKPNPPSHPLFLYVGTVAGPQAGGKISLHVTAGNRLGLRKLLGQSADQTFTYDENTIFLLWQGKVPTVIDPAQLKAGDRITVRIRAPRASTLSQIEATPAAHVGDHEPGNPLNETT